MDNPEEVYYNDLEEQYLNECSKFNNGDVVCFEHKVNDKNVISIGIVLNRGVKTFVKSSTEKDSKFTAIVYDIITPTELCKSVSECKITSASKYIYSQYISNTSR